MSILLHPSVISSAAQMIDAFMSLHPTHQVVLATLVKVRAAAIEGQPITDSLLGIMHCIGKMPRNTPQTEIDRASAEIYATLQIMHAREHGEVEYAVTQWWRDIV